MSISIELRRIKDAKKKIVDHLIAFGLVTGDDNDVKLDNAAGIVEKIAINTANKVLTATETEYQVPVGYHKAGGKVSIVPEDKTVTPTGESQDVTASEGKVLGKVTVAAIPGGLVDTSDANAVAGDILATKTGYVKGAKVTGTMPNNGAQNKTLNGMTEDPSVTVPAGYTTGGKITLGNEIEQALAEI